MPPTRPVVRWVADSTVRTDVVGTLAGRALETGDLHRAVDASESAVYAALNDLERRGLVEETDTGWRVSGRGRVVADILAQQRAIDGLFERDDQYWQHHDLAAVPREFRLRLDELAEYEIVRVTETDPRRVVREVKTVIEDAPWTRILAPIYLEEYATSMPDNDQSRLVLDTRVVQNALGQTIEEPGADEPSETEIRLGSAPVGLTLTPEVVMLSFPELDGGYDTRTELRLETERAREWGRDLFEHYWSRASPPSDFGEPKS